MDSQYFYCKPSTLGPPLYFYYRRHPQGIKVQALNFNDPCQDGIVKAQQEINSENNSSEALTFHNIDITDL